jgi:hypothetical protein
LTDRADGCRCAFRQPSAATLPGSMSARTWASALVGLSAGGRIPTIACGMDRSSQQKAEKWLMEADLASTPPAGARATSAVRRCGAA